MSDAHRVDTMGCLFFCKNTEIVLVKSNTWVQTGTRCYPLSIFDKKEVKTYDVLFLFFFHILLKFKEESKWVVPKDYQLCFIFSKFCS